MAYAFYQKEMTYRWAVICQSCYAQLDNEMGLGLIGVRRFNLAGVSRGKRAPGRAKEGRRGEGTEGAKGQRL